MRGPLVSPACAGYFCLGNRHCASQKPGVGTMPFACLVDAPRFGERVYEDTDRVVTGLKLDAFADYSHLIDIISFYDIMDVKERMTFVA